MLEIKNLSKTYRPKEGVPVKALVDINLDFKDKGMVFVLGKSGSGKSTFLNVLGGLDTYDEGDIKIFGKSSKDFTQADFDSYRNEYVGFVFQEYNVLEEFTVSQNITLALELQGKKATNDLIDEILIKVDLEGFGNRKPNELSIGQLQRVAIARALIKNPEIILADEPSGALDSSTGAQIFDTLKKISEDKLVIVVSHDRDFAEKYADRIIEFKDGKIVSDNAKIIDNKTSLNRINADVSTKKSDKEFKKTKFALPFKNSIKMAFCNLKVKKIRLTITILLKDSDLTGTNATICDNLFVNANDVDALKAYYAKAKLNDCSVVLFRFATSDYYSAPVDIIELKGGFLWSDKHTKNEAYRASESVFLDFDIIQLSFQKDGDLTVIPVVSSPIDVVDGITPPVDLDDEANWWKILLGIILLIVLLIVLFPILPWIIKFVFWIICLPFKAIKGIVKGIKERKTKKGDTL